MQEEDKKKEIVVGYVLMTLIVVIFGSVLIQLFSYFFSTDKTITVYFPKVGQLKVEQPFMYQGITVGEVTGFKENVYEGIAVTVQLNRPVVIREGYTLYAEDIDLFGYSKRIVLDNGPDDAPEIPEGRRLHGAYYPGLPEILSQVQKLGMGMEFLSNSFDGFLNGDPQAIRFLTALEFLKKNREQIVTVLDSFKEFLSKDVYEVIKQVNTFSDKSIQLVEQLKTTVPTIRNSTENVIARLDGALEVIPEYLQKIDEAVLSIESFESTDKSEPIITSLKEIQSQLVAAQENAHNLKVILRKYPKGAQE